MAILAVNVYNKCSFFFVSVGPLTNWLFASFSTQNVGGSSDFRNSDSASGYLCMMYMTRFQWDSNYFPNARYIGFFFMTKRVFCLGFERVLMI